MSKNQVFYGFPPDLQEPNSYDFRTTYDDEESESKFMQKAKQNPFIPAGIAGALVALGYSAFKFKNRGNQKVSVYLIHTRVAAQGAVVGAITLGCLYQICQEFIWNKKPTDSKP